MPYVPIRPEPRGVLLETAEQRWDAILNKRPDLKPAVDLQRGLLEIVVDLNGRVEASRLPRLSLPPKYLAAKLARGVPAFAGEPIPLPVSALKAALIRLAGALAEGGAGDSATHIAQAIENNSMDAGSLLNASLTRDQNAVRTGAVHRGLSPDLLWLIAELALSPFAHALQRMLFGRGDSSELSEGLAAWTQGYCPACGSWPALAEVVAGHRTLRCSFCAAGWERLRYACVYCDEGGRPFVTAAPDENRKDRRVEVCSHCTAYLKTVDLPELSPFPLLAIADLETLDLDVAAMDHGYRRPNLKDFSAKPQG